MCAGEQIIGIKFLPEALTACILQSWRWLISGAFYKIALLRITSLAILGEDCTEKYMHRMLVLFITEVRILNAPVLVTLLLLCGKARMFILNSFCSLIKCSSGCSAADPLFPLLADLWWDCTFSLLFGSKRNQVTCFDQWHASLPAGSFRYQRINSPWHISLPWQLLNIPDGFQIKRLRGTELLVNA